MPLAPYGPGPSAFSMASLSHAQRQVHARRDAVVDGAQVADAALVVVDEVLHERVAEAHDRGALVLAADLARVERPAHVGDRHVAGDGHVAGGPIDLDLDGGAVELEEGGRATERVVGIRLLAHLAEADDLAAEAPKAADEDVAHGPGALTDAHLAAIDRDRGHVHALEPSGHDRDLRLDVAAGVQDRVAHEHGRAAGRGLLVVWHDGGVAHDDRHPVERRAELLGGDLGEDGARTLAHV